MGDIMGHGPQINSAYDKTKKYDYSGVFNPLEEIISSVDFAIANLEVTRGTLHGLSSIQLAR